MRKTRAHPPTDRRTEDLKRLRREFRWAHRELDNAGAPRTNHDVDLSLAGRIRLLIELIASSAVALDGSASSVTAVRAAALARSSHTEATPTSAPITPDQAAIPAVSVDDGARTGPRANG